MSRAATKTQQAIDPSPVAPFEDAIKKLETIVELMESEELPLETLLERFEEGTKLVAYCQDRLVAADVRIRALEKSVEGSFALAPLQPVEEPSKD